MSEKLLEKIIEEIRQDKNLHQWQRAALIERIKLIATKET